jgi:3-deoxy-D-manno-octulosonate 8-phosphate phosphatase (KDO 8-P phosphatase)
MPNNKIKNIKALILDVDGVLTDGVMVYGNNGEEFKNFFVRDGKGISLAKLAGLEIFLMTSEKTRLILNRARKLGIQKNAYLGIKNKLKALKAVASKNKLSLRDIAFIGDDINDIPALGVVGLPVAVNDAVEEVKELVKKRKGLIMTKSGGKGAVRELIEAILKGQGFWEEIVQKDIKRQINEKK